MSKRVLKFNRDKPDEVTFARILAAEPGGVTAELAEAAGQFVQEKLRELRFSAPQLNGFDAFERVARGFPAATCVVIRAWTQGTVDAEAVEADYVMEEI